MEVINYIQAKINQLPYDLRAEVVVASILDELDASQDLNYYVNPLSQFKRSYRKDIVGADVIDFEFDARQFLKVNLSRDGIYDTLPEGILHYRQFQHTNVSADEMAKHYQERKKEEENARLFFLPFENEFFEHALDREKREKRYLLQLNGEKPMDFLYNFWGISQKLPQSLTAKFIRLIPYMYEIVGNLPLTEICLSYLLHEKVEIQIHDFKEINQPTEAVLLGDNQLGVDLVCGNTYLDPTIPMEVKIGPIHQSNFKDYLHQGPMQQFLEIFYEYIFPMEVELTTFLELEQEQKEFKLEENNYPILGITTRI